MKFKKCEILHLGNHAILHLPHWSPETNWLRDSPGKTSRVTVPDRMQTSSVLSLQRRQAAYQAVGAEAWPAE